MLLPVPLPSLFDPEPLPPVPPVEAADIDLGLGKTRIWETEIAPALAAEGMPLVVAVPRHKLGDESVERLAALGIDARVYRGLEAVDPEAPEHTMCRDLERAREVLKAGGELDRHACQHQKRV